MSLEREIERERERGREGERERGREGERKRSRQLMTKHYGVKLLFSSVTFECVDVHNIICRTTLVFDVDHISIASVQYQHIII
jgi:hypothetical protein